MLLERGEVVALGDPEDVGSRYLELNFGRDAATTPTPPRRTPRRAPATTTRGSPSAGSRTSTATARRRCVQGRSYTFRTPRRVRRATSRTRRSRDLLQRQAATSCSWPRRRAGTSSAGRVRRRRRGDVLVAFDVRLRARPLPAVGDRRPPRLGQRRHRPLGQGARRSSSSARRATGGLVDLPHRISIEPRARRAPETDRVSAAGQTRPHGARRPRSSARRRWPAASGASRRSRGRWPCSSSS